MSGRIDREIKTISLMIRLYCRHHHEPAGECCASCQQLETYAMQRTRSCRFGEHKPVCSACPVHCYREPVRRQVRHVMRYSGPRMALYHPWHAVMHVVDKKRTRNKNQH